MFRCYVEVMQVSVAVFVRTPKLEWPPEACRSAHNAKFQTLPFQSSGQLLKPTTHAFATNQLIFRSGGICTARMSQKLQDRVMQSPESRNSIGTDVGRFVVASVACRKIATTCVHSYRKEATPLRLTPKRTGTIHRWTCRICRDLEVDLPAVTA